MQGAASDGKVARLATRLARRAHRSSSRRCFIDSSHGARRGVCVRVVAPASDGVRRSLGPRAAAAVRAVRRAPGRAARLKPERVQNVERKIRTRAIALVAPGNWKGTAPGPFARTRPRSTDGAPLTRWAGATPLRALW